MLLPLLHLRLALRACEGLGAACGPVGGFARCNSLVVTSVVARVAVCFVALGVVSLGGLMLLLS